MIISNDYIFHYSILTGPLLSDEDIFLLKVQCCYSRKVCVKLTGPAYSDIWTKVSLDIFENYFMIKLTFESLNSE